MARLIDADALLAEYDRQHEGEPGKARKLIEDAPTVAAVPVSKILALRDALYEADAVTMRGLRNLNLLIAKYEGGKDHAPTIDRPTRSQFKRMALHLGYERVVRCNDCKFWQDNNDGYPHEECRWGHGETPDANDFCSYGERRT